MESGFGSFGLIVSLILGLWLIIKFRELGEFVDEATKDIPAPFPKTWHLKFAQGMIFLIGVIVVISAAQGFFQ